MVKANTTRRRTGTWARTQLRRRCGHDHAASLPAAFAASVSRNLRATFAVASTGPHHGSPLRHGVASPRRATAASAARGLASKSPRHCSLVWFRRPRRVSRPASARLCLPPSTRIPRISRRGQNQPSLDSTAVAWSHRPVSASLPRPHLHQHPPQPRAADEPDSFAVVYTAPP